MSTRHVAAEHAEARDLTPQGVSGAALRRFRKRLASDGFATDEGWRPKPGYLYTVVRAISARVNQNWDGWPSEELKKSYKTFLGKPCFVNHENHDPTKARGVVVAARYVENGMDKYIEVVQEIDAERFPKLAHEIKTGGLDSVSMGAEAGFTICSYCHNKATDLDDMCDHVRNHKGKTLTRFDRKTGKKEDVLVFESCHKISFFELSYVFEPADETAVASKVVVAGLRPEKRIASNNRGSAGYEYQGMRFSPQKMVQHLIDKKELPPQASENWPEDALNQHAMMKGINRYDETSYSSDQHPKQVHYHQLDAEKDFEWYPGFSNFENYSKCQHCGENLQRERDGTWSHYDFDSGVFPSPHSGVPEESPDFQKIVGWNPDDEQDPFDPRIIGAGKHTAAEDVTVPAPPGTPTIDQSIIDATPVIELNPATELTGHEAPGVPKQSFAADIAEITKLAADCPPGMDCSRNMGLANGMEQITKDSPNNPVNQVSYSPGNLGQPGSAVVNGGGGSPDADNILPGSRALYDALMSEHPGSEIGGYRVDSYGEHAKGALDFMTNDDAVAAKVRERAFEHGAPYVIWKQQQWDAPWHNSGGVTMMEDRGDPTQNHFDHVHIAPLNPSRATINRTPQSTQSGTVPAQRAAGKYTKEDFAAAGNRKPWETAEDEDSAAAIEIEAMIVQADGPTDDYKEWLAEHGEEADRERGVRTAPENRSLRQWVEEIENRTRHYATADLRVAGTGKYALYHRMAGGPRGTRKLEIETPEGQGKPRPTSWFHTSDSKLPVGTKLIPGGGESPYSKYYEDEDEEDRRNHVWLEGDPKDLVSKMWAGPDSYIYQVQPEQEPSNEYGWDGWVTPSAIITKYLGTGRDHGAQEWDDEDEESDEDVDAFFAEIDRQQRERRERERTAAQAMVRQAMPYVPETQSTQRGNTLATNINAHRLMDSLGAPEGKYLDFGAGYGRSGASPDLKDELLRGLGYDTFEPNPGKNFIDPTTGMPGEIDPETGKSSASPTFTATEKIPDGAYQRIQAANVLNVLRPGEELGERHHAVREIGRLLAPGGHAVITTRAWKGDVDRHLPVDGPAPINEPNAIWTGSNPVRYQKGFDRHELAAYLQEILGEGFQVHPGPSGLGGASAYIIKSPGDGKTIARRRARSAAMRKTARNRAMKLAYGEVEAPMMVDTLREEGSAPEDDNDDFERYVDPPKELQTPDLSQAAQIDRQQEAMEANPEGAGVPGPAEGGPPPDQGNYITLKVPMPSPAPQVPAQAVPAQAMTGMPPVTASMLNYFDRYFGHRVANWMDAVENGRPMNPAESADYRRQVAGLLTLEKGRELSTNDRNPQKGTATMARKSMSRRSKVATAGRRQHFAEGPLVDGGDRSRNDQGEQEEAFISQTPEFVEADVPTDDTHAISNTEHNLVARVQRGRDQLLRDARQLAALQKRRAFDESGGPTAEVVDPTVNSGREAEDLTGDDFISADPNDGVTPTNPKDASLRAFRAFDGWLAQKTGKSSRRHSEASIKRAAAQFSREAGISPQALFPALGIVLREARKNDKKANTRGAKMRKRADEKLEVAAPDGRIDVEAPVSDTTDAKAQASQFDIHDFGNNAGDNVANPDLSTDQNWAPGEASKTSARVKTAGGLLAMRCAEGMIAAGLEPDSRERKYQLAAEYENMNRGLIQDRVALLERFAAVRQAERRKVASGMSRGAARSPIPAGMGGGTRTASSQRVAAHDPLNDSSLFI